MPGINMIAAKRAEKQRLEMRVRIVFLVVLAEVTMTIGLFSFMTARIYAAGKTIYRLEHKLSKNEPMVEKIEDFQTRIDDLRPRLTLLENSRRDTLLWHTLLQNLSHSMAPATWLNSVTTIEVEVPTGDGKKLVPTKAVGLKGVSQNQRQVGETMLRLGQFPEIERVNLNYTQKGGNSDMETLDFDLSAVLTPYESGKGGESKDVQY